MKRVAFWLALYWGCCLQASMEGYFYFAMIWAVIAVLWAMYRLTDRLSLPVQPDPWPRRQPVMREKIGRAFDWLIDDENRFGIAFSLVLLAIIITFTGSWPQALNFVGLVVDLAVGFISDHWPTTNAEWQQLAIVVVIVVMFHKLNKIIELLEQQADKIK